MAQRALPKEMEEKMQKAKDMKPEDMLFTYKGVLYPSLLCKPENFKAMERFEAREDDILLVAYPKCGECIIYYFDVLVVIIYVVAKLSCRFACRLMG